MKKLLLIFALAAVVTSRADTPVKDIKITGSNSQIASGAFAVKSGATVTYESGSTLNVSAATVKVATITSPTNGDITVDANGTGVFVIKDTISTGTNADLVVDANGTGKLVIKDTISTGTNADLVEDANGTGKFIVSDTISTPTNADLTITPNGTGKIAIGAAFTDVTTGNASTSAHGLQKKLSGNSYDYAGGDGNYSIPSQAPLNTQNAAYTFVIGDAGKTIFHDEATTRTYTIPANSSVAYPIGTMITIINNTGGGAITLSITTDTLRRGDGTAGTGSRTIAADSVVTIIKTKSTEWFITGKFS